MKIVETHKSHLESHMAGVGPWRYHLTGCENMHVV